jgi:membrane protein
LRGLRVIVRSIVEIVGPVPLLISSVRLVVVETYAAWRSHRTIRLGASLAYYGLFAIVPLLAISLAVAGLVISEADVEELLASILGNVVNGDGEEYAAQVTERINASGTTSSLGLIGVGSLLLTASLVFVALQDAFDTIWEFPVSHGTWATLRRRLLAFAVVLLAGAFLVASFAVISISNLVRTLLPGSNPLVDAGAELLASVGSIGLLAVVMALLFQFLTRDGLAWKIAGFGGGATAFALTVGNRLFIEYMRRFGASSLVGVTGSVLVGIVWIYTIAQIVLAGAELTRILQKRHEAELGADDAGTTPDGSGMQPA